MTLRFHFLGLLLIATGLTCSATAHNGHISIAQQVNGITIDGDLSDWPNDMKSHFIATTIYVSDGSPSGKGFKGRFRVGSNRDENAIYLAVEIEDDSIVLEGNGEEWNSRDACEIFFDLEHTPQRTSPVQFVYRGRPYAVFQNRVNEELVSACKAARASEDSRLIYEWRVDLTELSDDEDYLANGRVIGFDVSFLDRDSDALYAFYSSSPGSKKHLTSTDLADLVVPAANKEIAEVSGRVRWSDDNVAHAAYLRIQSLTHASTFFQLPLTASGQFMANLPTGDYELTAVASAPATRVSRPKRVSITRDTQLDPSTKFEVAREEDTETPNLSGSVVYYDLAHGEQLQSQIRRLGDRLGFSLRSSDEPLSRQSLGNTQLLYVRAPKSRFSEAEKKVVVDFVRNGGSLLLVMDEQKRTSLEETQVNDLIAPFGLRFTDDTDYLHNCGAISKAGDIHRNDLEVPFSGGRAVEGGKSFGFQLDRDGNPSHAFASSVETQSGGKIVVLGEGMATLFLGSQDGQRLSGSPDDYARTNYWGKDSAQFNADILTWLLSNEGA